MKKYYWNIEKQEIITIDELKQNHAEFYSDIGFSDFLRLCSSANNGNLESLEKEITREKTLVNILKKECAEETEINAIWENVIRLSSMARETV